MVVSNFKTKFATSMAIHSILKLGDSVSEIHWPFSETEIKQEALEGMELQGVKTGNPLGKEPVFYLNNLPIRKYHTYTTSLMVLRRGNTKGRSE